MDISSIPDSVSWTSDDVVSMALDRKRSNDDNDGKSIRSSGKATLLCSEDGYTSGDDDRAVSVPRFRGDLISDERLRPSAMDMHRFLHSCCSLGPGIDSSGEEDDVHKIASTLTYQSARCIWWTGSEVDTHRIRRDRYARRRGPYKVPRRPEGRFYINRSVGSRSARRLVYTWYVGDVGAGEIVCSRCPDHASPMHPPSAESPRARLCVNPFHLRKRTPKPGGGRPTEPSPNDPFPLSPSPPEHLRSLSATPSPSPSSSPSASSSSLSGIPTNRGRKAKYSRLQEDPIGHPRQILYLREAVFKNCPTTPESERHRRQMMEKFRQSISSQSPDPPNPSFKSITG